MSVSGITYELKNFYLQLKAGLILWASLESHDVIVIIFLAFVFYLPGQLCASENQMNNYSVVSQLFRDRAAVMAQSLLGAERSSRVM